MVKPPLLVVPNGDAKAWEPVVKQLQWQLLTPALSNWSDRAIRQLESEVQRAGADATRVYLAGQGDQAAAVFFVVSRLPEPWAAALAIGGSPRAAIDSNRLFGANTRLVPLLWISGKDNPDAPLAEKLKAAEYNVEVRPEASPGEAFAWLAQRRRDPLPAGIDCETGSPAFARCYWIEMTRFDPAERNDVLLSSRLSAGSRASLDLGGFGFNPQGEGPGVLIGWLPPNYQGPLKLNDRIVSIGGKPVTDGRAYVRMMDETKEEKEAAVLVQRGKERIRLETRVILPKPEEMVTARVKADYLPELKQIQIVSRAVAEIKVHVPEAWAPAGLNWNGTDLPKAETAGCWLLRLEKELARAARCP